MEETRFCAEFYKAIEKKRAFGMTIDSNGIIDSDSFF